MLSPPGFGRDLREVVVGRLGISAPVQAVTDPLDDAIAQHSLQAATRHAVL